MKAIIIILTSKNYLPYVKYMYEILLYYIKMSVLTILLYLDTWQQLTMTPFHREMTQLMHVPNHTNT